MEMKLLFLLSDYKGACQCLNPKLKIEKHRSSRSEVFLGNSVLKTCSKCTREHPCRSAISIKLLCSFIEIALRHGCSPVNFPAWVFSCKFAAYFQNTLGGCFWKQINVPANCAKHIFQCVGLIWLISVISEIRFLIIINILIIISISSFNKCHFL